MRYILKEKELRACIKENIASCAGSTEWDIYVNAEGTFDCRHNTHTLAGWFQVFDFYDCELEENDSADEYVDSLEFNCAEIINAYRDAILEDFSEKLEIDLE